MGGYFLQSLKIAKVNFVRPKGIIKGKEEKTHFRILNFQQKKISKKLIFQKTLKLK
jgi:hypothetical protein